MRNNDAVSSKRADLQILLIHQAFTTLDEAGGTRHFEIALNLVKNGHSITIITSPISYMSGQKKNSRDFEEHLNAKIKILRTYAYPALHKSFFHRTLNFISFMASSFFKGIQLKNLDLVWGTSPPIFQAASAWLIARLRKIPFLLEIRDLWPAFAIEVGVLKSPLLIRLSQWLEKFLYRHADMVIVNSPGFIEHVKSKGATKVEMIPNGSDIQLFTTSKDCNVFRKNLGIQDKYVVVYAGAHGISNDLEVVLKAANLLSDQPRIHFLLVGDGKEKPFLIETARKLGLINLTFMDPVSKNKMALVLAAADACLAILKPLEMYKTTYPNKVFDYMAAGKPVLLAIDGVIRQVVEDAKCGIFIEPGNADDLAKKISWLSNHPREAKKMGLAGRQQVKEKFNRVRLAGRFTAIFEELVKNG